MTFVAAAGNDGDDACLSSPARVDAVLTVGASDSTDAAPGWSNGGNCIDLFAPGSSITSAWATSDTAANTISGTSMAAPHVAGAAARYLQSNPSASPAEVSNHINSDATPHAVSLAYSVNDRLLHTVSGRLCSRNSRYPPAGSDSIAHSTSCGQP